MTAAGTFTGIRIITFRTSHGISCWASVAEKNNGKELRIPNAYNDLSVFVCGDCVCIFYVKDCVAIPNQINLLY